MAKLADTVKDDAPVAIPDSNDGGSGTVSRSKGKIKSKKRDEQSPVGEQHDGHGGGVCWCMCVCVCVCIAFVALSILCISATWTHCLSFSLHMDFPTSPVCVLCIQFTLYMCTCGHSCHVGNTLLVNAQEIDNFEHLRREMEESMFNSLVYMSVS